MAGTPFFATRLAIARHFLSQFMAQLSGLSLSRLYSAGYVSVCGPLALGIIVGRQQVLDRTSGWRTAATAMLFLRRGSVTRPLEPPSARRVEALAQSGVSARAAEVITLILTGLSHKEIADRLSISPETV